MIKFIKTLFILLGSFLASAQADDRLILVDEDNAAMQSAFKKAQETLNAFIARATVDRKDFELYGAYIKVEEGETVEYLWVADFSKYDETYFMGVILSKPELITKLKEGQTVGFVKEDIFDWQIYNQNTDELEGAFTFEVLMKEAKHNGR